MESSPLPPLVLHVFPDLLSEVGEVLGLALELRGLLGDPLARAGEPRVAMSHQHAWPNRT